MNWIKNTSTLFFLTLALVACDRPKVVLDKMTIPVDTAHFIKANLVEAIAVVEHRLSDGSKEACYKIVTKSVPEEHQMGPWCPRHIEDSKAQGGIWFEKGKVYDVDGHFISSIANFYADSKWKLYNEDGSIKVTVSQEACEGAAKPNVEAIYKNHCVECQPSFYHDHLTTYYLPVKPKLLSKAASSRRGILGLAFNGVNFDPPAPTEAILKAHTLAPLDDCGGHVNPHSGYHYHAVRSCTKAIAQADEHAPLIGYAIDGIGIYALADAAGNKTTDLDACGGHEDALRGYHYHAGEAGSNQILACLYGATGEMIVSH